MADAHEKGKDPKNDTSLSLVLSTKSKRRDAEEVRDENSGGEEYSGGEDSGGEDSGGEDSGGEDSGEEAIAGTSASQRGSVYGSASRHRPEAPDAPQWRTEPSGAPKKKRTPEERAAPKKKRTPEERAAHKKKRTPEERAAHMKKKEAKNRKKEKEQNKKDQAVVKQLPALMRLSLT